MIRTRQQAAARAAGHVPTGLVALAAATTRLGRFGVWVVAPRDPADPGARREGGALVVTDEGDVHEIGPLPGSLDDLMLRLGRQPVAPSRPSRDTDEEAMALLWDEDPDAAREMQARCRR